MKREWADVYVPSPPERIALEGRALFFIPAAAQRCAEAGLTTGYLGSLSNAGPILGPSAGRVAIRKVMHQHPVSYERAVGFLNVANYAFEERGLAAIELSDIVACVFRLKDPLEITAELGVTPEAISSETGISIAIINAALMRYRLQYRDAEAIRRLLLSIKAESGKHGPRSEAALTETASDFMRTDARQPLAIKPLEDDEYVYTWESLSPAPKTGHYWAIEVEDDH